MGAHGCKPCPLAALHGPGRDDCVNLSVLPGDLHAERLSARDTPSLKEVDGRLSVRDTINLRGSGVQAIRADLHATRSDLAHCTSLRRLEGRISIVHLDVRGCASLQTLGDDVHVTQTLELAKVASSEVPAHFAAPACAGTTCPLIKNRVHARTVEWARTS